MINTDRHWEKGGKQHPYYGVLADEKFNPDNIHLHRDEFFATGGASLAQILKRYESHFGRLPRGFALDHGCGVGRITLPMAKEFSRVVGLDISASMLAEAETNASEFGVENAEFLLADDALSNAQGKFDFVNSLFVLQHVPVGRGLPIFTRLVDKVRPGGGFHIHFSVRTDSPASRFVYWSSCNIPGVKIYQNIRWKRPWNAPAMQMNNYPLNRIIAHLASRGITELITFAEQHSKFVTCGLVGR